ncbi:MULTISPECIES: DMT family transporter [Acinetobacter]|uniref:DMT family transporter n=1 Tax=Acinetobacter TaxID=469 RepID=UPI000E3567E3|nr:MULTISPECIES: DMT family transporter [Acinetobacter]RFS31711.1 DMT family transporter [Acinetobacter sp. SWAC5]RKG45573.1 DMT family transporter [Acinetobacter cumulans]RKG49418.1 DMT family transporter [Acinetobacter cumulans]RZG60578.1 DMT family transporter [Acinetobacter sp. WCHAc060006]
MPTLSLSPRQMGALCAICAAFLFSTKAIFIKQAYALSPLVDATVLMALRMGSALPFFLIMCWFSRRSYQDLTARDWGMLILAGLLGYYLASWLDFMGLMYISASLERIILFLYPTLTVLASSVIYKQKLSIKTYLAILLSYGGTVLVMLQEQSNAPQDGNFWIGASFVFASAVAFASYLLLTPKMITKFGSWHFNALALSIACLGTLIHYVLSVPAPIQLIQNLPPAVWGYGIAIGLFVTVLPTVLMMQSIVRLGPGHSAMIASIGPILTILLAVAFLDEHLNSIQWLGCLLNIVGVLMISLSKK